MNSMDAIAIEQVTVVVSKLPEGRVLGRGKAVSALRLAARMLSAAISPLSGYAFLSLCKFGLSDETAPSEDQRRGEKQNGGSQLQVGLLSWRVAHCGPARGDWPCGGRHASRKPPEATGR